MAVEREQRPSSERDQLNEQHAQARRRPDQQGQEIRPYGAPRDTGQLVLEASEDGVLQPKGLDDRLSADVLVDGARELPLVLLQLVVGPRGARREGAGHQHDQRQGDHEEQRESPLEQEQQGNVHDEADQCQHRIGEARRESLLDVCQVAGEMRDNVPGLRAREKIHR